MFAGAAIIGHCVNSLAVEVRTTDFPTPALNIRSQEECSFCGSYQQKKVSLPDRDVLHTVENRRGWSASINDWIRGRHQSRVNCFQSCLHFTGALITLHRLLCEAPLNN